MRDNPAIVAAYVANAARLGRSVVDPRVVGRRVVGSTDMGNVSYLVPSIHPMIKVAPDGVPFTPPSSSDTPVGRQVIVPSSTGPRPWR
jgi:urease gamma subunit